MYRAYCAFARRFAFVPSRTEFEDLNGPPLAMVVEVLRERHRLPVGQAQALETYLGEVRAASDEVLPSYGASSLLQTARAGRWRVGIVTSNDGDLVKSWLERESLMPFVTTVVDGQVRPSKPDGAPYRVALDRLNCSAAESIAVEDSQAGYAAAAAAGVRVVYYRPLDRAAGPPGAQCVDSLLGVSSLLGADDRPRAALRLATPSDLPFLYALRSDPSVMADSRVSRPLSPRELEERFRLDESLRDKIIIVAEYRAEPAAMIRFDRRGSDYLISVIVAKSTRGHGFGTAALGSAIDAFLAMLGPVALFAEVAESNVASARLFGRCGFELVGRDGRFLLFGRACSPLHSGSLSDA